MSSALSELCDYRPPGAPGCSRFRGKTAKQGGERKDGACPAPPRGGVSEAAQGAQVGRLPVWIVTVVGEGQPRGSGTQLEGTGGRGAGGCRVACVPKGGRMGASGSPGGSRSRVSPSGAQTRSLLAVTRDPYLWQQQVALLACPAPRSSLSPPAREVTGKGLLLPEVSEPAGTSEDEPCPLPTLCRKIVLMASLIASFRSLAYLPRQSVHYLSRVAICGRLQFSHVPPHTELT